MRHLPGRLDPLRARARLRRGRAGRAGRAADGHPGAAGEPVPGRRGDAGRGRLGRAAAAGRAHRVRGGVGRAVGAGAGGVRPPAAGAVAGRDREVPVPGLGTPRTGVAHWVRPFELGGDLVGATADSLADFGRVIGARLAPIGAEQAGDAIIAVDENSRVWVLDQAGEWYAGPDLDTAFVVLLQGHPMPRVRDDGTLEPPA
ncbi:SUKH-3 domain-containing protein [Catellatospora coxensis]